MDLRKLQIARIELHVLRWPESEQPCLRHMDRRVQRVLASHECDIGILLFQRGHDRWRLIEIGDDRVIDPDDHVTFLQFAFDRIFLGYLAYQTWYAIVDHAATAGCDSHRHEVRRQRDRDRLTVSSYFYRLDIIQQDLCGDELKAPELPSAIVAQHLITIAESAIERCRVTVDTILHAVCRQVHITCPEEQL